MDPIPENINSIETIEKLIESGHDSINKKYGQYHVTLLHLFAGRNRIDIVKYLLDHGADLTITNLLGQTPLHIAVRGQHYHMVVYLIERGANIDAQTLYQSNTPLHIAMDVRRLDIVKYLLDSGVNKELCDSYGKTAADVSKIGNDNIAEYIRSYEYEITKGVNCDN